MNLLWQIADSIRSIRRRMRSGALSRAPLTLLRLEVKGDSAECEWMARPADPWDLDLPPYVRERNLADQALRDVIELRKLLFAELPQVMAVKVRVHRQCAGEAQELIIAGTIDRDTPSYVASSLAMYVKLCGLQFHLNDGKLEPL